MPRIQYITVHINLGVAKKLVQPAWGSAPERKAGDPTAPRESGNGVVWGFSGSFCLVQRQGLHFPGIPLPTNLPIFRRQDGKHGLNIRYALIID
jgi:hypothetical protein